MLANPKQWWIAKPATGTLSNGIFLVNRVEDVPAQGDYLMQEYVTDAMLYNGHKTDTRVIYMITSLDPLIAYYHPAGFTRVTKERFVMPTEHNKGNKAIHITTVRATYHSQDHSQIPFTDDGDRAAISQYSFIDHLNKKKVFNFNKTFYQKIHKLNMRAGEYIRTQFIETGVQLLLQTYPVVLANARNVTRVLHDYPRKYYGMLGPDCFVY